jgi:uncharacterized protein (UPF0332 family)
VDTGTSADYLKAKLDRSQEDLADALDLFQQGKYRLSINRAYYAVFHIISATLAAMGQVRRKHSSVEAAFHQYLIKPGLLEPEHGITYKLARKWREDADYAIDALFTEEIAQDILGQCERLAKRMEQLSLRIWSLWERSAGMNCVG